MIRRTYIDWDNGKLTILALGGRRGFSELKFQCMETEGSPNPVMAEEQGEQLKTILRDLGGPGQKSLVCLGRDRLIARQLTIPRVGVDEEPSLVKFQVLRDLNEAPEEIRLDYLPFDVPEGSDRRVLALMIRVELFNAWKTILGGAQAKMGSLCPRLAGLGGLIGDLGPQKEPVALVAHGGNWAELGVFINGQNIFSRSLNPQTNLIQEVKRSLSLFAAQNEALAPKSIFLLASPQWKGDADLAQATNLPLQRLSPFDGILGARPLTPAEEEHTASLGVLMGLARLEEKGGVPSPDFANPRQPPPPSQLGKQRVLLYSLVGLVALVIGAYYLWGVKNRTFEDLDLLTRKRDDLKKDLDAAKLTAKRVQALADWDDVVWLDEFYDLTHRIPNTKELQLTEIMARPRPSKDKESEFRSQLVVKGELPGGPDKVAGLRSLVEEIRKDPNYKIEKQLMGKNGSEFTLEIDVKRRIPDEYKREIKPPAKEKAKAAEPTSTKEAPKAGGEQQ